MKERQEAAGVVAQRKRFPAEGLAGRTLPRTGAHGLVGDPGGSEPLHDGVHVPRAMSEGAAIVAA
jgi:hypothetical protein